MKTLFIALLAFCLFSFPAMAGEKAPEIVTDFVNRNLVKLGENTVIVAAVEAQNAQKKTLDQIVKEDRIWREQTGISPLMKQVLENECAQYLKFLQKSRPFLVEIFVMDNLGANVASTNRTSDYWQGDEDKFQKSMNKGEGAVFIDEVKYDESAKANLVQASVPVMSKGNAIGAITFGIDLDQLRK